MTRATEKWEDFLVVAFQEYGVEYHSKVITGEGKKVFMPYALSVSALLIYQVFVHCSPLPQGLACELWMQQLLDLKDSPLYPQHLIVPVTQVSHNEVLKYKAFLCYDKYI